MRKFILTTFILFLSVSGFAQTEIQSRRTYNTKVFDIGGNQKTYEMHVGHIHYKDKTTKEFKNVNYTIRDNSGVGWIMDKSNYEITIPEYADEEFIFTNNYEGADHSIKATPQANHVHGVLANNSVLYTDAFGAGIDLKVNILRSGLQKVVVINSKPSGTGDIYFDFLVNVTPGQVVKEDESQWDKLADLDFTDKNLRVGSGNKYSYFNRSILWDSAGYQSPVNIKLYVNQGKTYLRKTISRATLDSVTYPLYTDHPTDYYAGAGDGEVWVTNANWDTAHDATDGTGVNYTTTDPRAQVRLLSGTYHIYRKFIPIDTSDIDDGDTVTSANLNIYVVDIRNKNRATSYYAVVQTSQASTSSLSTADFDTCGDSIDNPTQGSANLDIGDFFTASQYNVITLNATGLSWIDKTGVTKLGARVGADIEDFTPFANDLDSIQISPSEETGTSQDPYLSVTTSAGGRTRRTGIVTH